MSIDFVAAENLTKCYSKRTALNGLSLAVKGGEVIGLLGPNGAGKTTALSILATILHPDSGRATICGHDVVKETDAARSHLGLVTQSIAIYPALSGHENLGFFALMQGLSRRTARALVQRMLDQVGLADRAQDAAGRARRCRSPDIGRWTVGRVEKGLGASLLLSERLLKSRFAAERSSGRALGRSGSHELMPPQFRPS